MFWSQGISGGGNGHLGDVGNLGPSCYPALVSVVSHVVTRQVKIPTESVGRHLFHLSFLSVIPYFKGKHGVTKVVGAAEDHGGQGPTVSGSHIMLKNGAESAKFDFKLLKLFAALCLCQEPSPDVLPLSYVFSLGEKGED